ncbi:MAG: hypothetical protein KBF45_05810 [Cyclobacteriaceae bacterium]|jgi:EamA domain-containing membrane protein RarD|nr:hypothetical protein [Cyclobacteriaceae bacterium]
MLRIIKRYVPYIQQLGLAISVAGLVGYYADYSSLKTLLEGGLLLLSLSYFLWTFLPMDIPPHSEPDVYATLAHKLLYISCSVMLMGALFSVLKKSGHHEITLVGGISLMIALGFTIFLMIRKREHYVTLRDAFIRGISSALLALLALALH